MTLSKRFCAFLTDLFLLSFLKKGLIIYYFYTLKKMIGSAPLLLSEKGILFNLFDFSIFLALFTGYFISFYFLTNGQTPGKFLFDLKVESQLEKRQTPLTLSECVLRVLGYIVCYLSGAILFLIPFFNKRNFGIQDWISNTQVRDLSLKNEGLKNELLEIKNNHYYQENESFDLHQITEDSEEYKIKRVS